MRDRRSMNLLYPGAISEVGRILSAKDSCNVFCVLDDPAYEASGATNLLEPVLQNHRICRFRGFEVNPKLADVERGVTLARAFSPDYVLAVGGGTAIDLAKLIGCLMVQPSTALDVITGRQAIRNEGPPLIAIPTTAGTGSEATHFAVVYVGENKYSLAHPTLLPTHSIVDPQLTASLPRGIAAATGLDALCQGIESLWAVGATDESVAFATEAVELACANLVEAVNSPSEQSRMAMCRASHLAGKAINISKTTSSHALSYSITSNYGIPHGIAVALTLSQMLVFNANLSDEDCSDSRGANHVRQRIATIVRLLGATTPSDASDRFTAIVKKIGCPTSLAEAGITNMDQLQKIVSAVNTERLSNNPRRATPAELCDLLSPSIAV